MSWEEMHSETRPCPCGKGTITYFMDMDDWNRTRSHETINCHKCKAAAEEKSRQEAERHQKREALLSQALKIAEKRYLARWLAMFANRNKKEAWLLYTGGSGYPALGTFYKHVKDEGVEHYLRWSFSSDFRRALHKMNVVDNDIQKLLTARDKI